MRFKRFFWNIFSSLLLACSVSAGLTYLLSQIEPESEMAVCVAIALVFMILLAGTYFLARMVYKPIRLLESRMSRMAERGTLQLPQRESESFEIYDLARSIDSISNQLNSRVEVVVQQKNEQEAVLSSMSEGVIALDANKNILHMNRAAAQILSVPRTVVQNQKVVEVIRVPEILDLIDEAMIQKKGAERDVDLPQQDGVRHMQVRVRPLLQANAASSGLVLVLSDITRIRELEGMRKTFVANVSHELRTPLTSIQGFAETLLNPAVQDAQEMKKYIAVIQKHASRLNQIIEDLLSLSRLEKDIEDNQVELKKARVCEVIQNALEVCQVSAQARQISLVSEVDKDLETEMDRNLIEQAVVNLIDNAIRYSSEGQQVKVQAKAKDGHCLIQVIDQGVGIPEKHLGRIFERFYRVDKARGREAGGTGLGLSIVKYIAQAHRGQVEVQSQLGQGSTFSITLPLKNRES